MIWIRNNKTPSSPLKAHLLKKKNKHKIYKSNGIHDWVCSILSLIYVCILFVCVCICELFVTNYIQYYSLIRLACHVIIIDSVLWCNIVVCLFFSPSFIEYFFQFQSKSIHFQFISFDICSEWQIVLFNLY